MASDAEVQQTAEEMNLPLEYVQAVYAEDEKPGKETTASEEDGSPSPQAEETVQPTAPPTEAVSGDIPEKLASRAKHYGLDPEKFRNAEALQDQIDAYDRQLIAQTQQQHQQAPQQQPDQQQARQQLYDQQRAQQAAAQQQSQQQPQSQQPPQFQFELGDEYDPEEVAKFNAGLQQIGEYIAPVVGQVQQLQEVVQQQNQYIQQMVQREQAVQVEETNKAFDAAVDGLEAEVFGKGRYEELGVPEQTQRSKLMDSAHTLAMAYSQRGIPIPEMSELVEQAFRLTFAEEAKKTNQAELRQRVVDRSKKRLGTGTTNKSSHVAANGKVKPYRGKDPAQDPVLIGAYNEMLAEQDFR